VERLKHKHIKNKKIIDPEPELPPPRAMFI
jgi:hypothetical protein